MDKHLQEESERLKQSWLQHDQTMLRDYLVSSVEDPRLNLQSILTRHFLTEVVFHERFLALQTAEMRFAAAMNWLDGFFRQYPSREDAHAMLHALSTGSDDADGIEVPFHILRVFKSLPESVESMLVPHYLREALTHASRSGAAAVPDDIKSTFLRLWKRRFARFRPKPVKVLEPACGSANDYRFFDACGLARFLDYTGFDLCGKNVANARALFPAVRFIEGNAFQIDAPDRAFSFAVVHDLFEHLSLKGMDTALREISRVTQHGLCLHFFNMDEEAPKHIVQPVEQYHWNRLSLDQTRNLLARLGWDHIQALHIGAFIDSVLPGAETHNPNAYTLLALRA